MKKAFIAGLIFMASGQALEAREVFGDTFGDGVAAYTLQYYEDARRIWRPLAEAGNAEAAWRLADLHERGLGGPRDGEEAARLLRQAADAGHPEASKEYLKLMAKGRGAGADEEESIRLVRAAGQSGQSWAAWQMAARYLEGNGVEKDKAAALAWFRCAAGGTGSNEERARAADMAKKLEAVLLERTIARAGTVPAC